MNDEIVQVKSLYDSHVHWLMTGEKKSHFDLQGYNSFSEISAQSFESKNFRGDWVFGFGWNDTQLRSDRPFVDLDRLSPNQPICFIKKDAHSCILNRVALDLVMNHLDQNPALNQFIEKDAEGNPTGVLKESAFYSIYSIVPPLSRQEMRRCLLEAQVYFQSKGFTHIRDMTCSISQWGVLKEMQNNGDLKIIADINFNVDTLTQATQEIVPFILRESRPVYSNLKIKGIKIFYDGSLGSQTALLFENYKETNKKGNSLWTQKDVYELMKTTWLNGFDVSVHTLGDKAVDDVVEVARSLYSQKVRGYLNLEHVELIRPETISKMKSLFVRCHMQPSHWLSDRTFLNQRLDANTLKNVFSWESLRKAKVALSFGSDSPIEEADVLLTYQALQQSKNFGIEEFGGNVFDFYRHPEHSLTKESPITHFKNYRPVVSSTAMSPLTHIETEEKKLIKQKLSQQ